MKGTKLLGGLLLLGTMLGCQEPQKGETNPEVTEAAPLEVEAAVSEELLRHVVLFKFKDEASAEEVAAINQAFLDLPNSIPVIKDFEWGLNDSPEDLHQGFTHCYLLSFATVEDRDSVYAPHPQHQAFVELLGPHLDKVLVVDYWAK